MSMRRTPFIGTRLPLAGSLQSIQGWVCTSCRKRASHARRGISTAGDAADSQASTTVSGRHYAVDTWTNTTSSILKHVPRKLHLLKDHPISITRQLIESRFPGYKTYNDLEPVVTTKQNFDSLGFPPDHPGRSKTDTYYINNDTVLRTHTSAHQADVFRRNESNGWLISADVYRRDAVDRSHYPVFHQMEGAYTWSKGDNADAAVDLSAETIWDDVQKVPKHSLNVVDPNPPFHTDRNPLQENHHSAQEAEAIGAHLKRSLENVVVEIFAQAKKAKTAAGLPHDEEPLQVRWIEAYFPFTSPSWELEVWWDGEWLEVLGCGVVKQEVLINAGVPQRIGWAFGLGLERIAMLLFGIPDIRLFWSQDQRFLSQFKSPFEGVAQASTTNEAPRSVSLRSFQPYSKYPAAPRDISFWLPEAPDASAAGGRLPAIEMHENDFMEIVRDIAGNSVEDVRLIDEFTHPKTGRRSRAYRIVYRSLDRTLTSQEIAGFHSSISHMVTDRYHVELR